MTGDRILLEQFDALVDIPEAVERLRRFVLDLAVRGKLVAQDPTDEPASVLLERIEAEKRRRYKAGEIRKPKALKPVTEAERPFDAPTGWIWTRVGVIGAINPRNKLDDDMTVSFVPMTLIEDGVGSGHTSEERSWSQVKKGYTHFAEGDIGLAKITPCFQNRKSVIFKNLSSGYGAGTTELHVLRPGSTELESLYILLFLQSERFIEGGLAQMTGTAGQQRVPRSYFEEAAVCLPPLAEQRRIVARIDELMALCDRLGDGLVRRDALHQTWAASTVRHVTEDAPIGGAPPWSFAEAHLDALLADPEAVPLVRRMVLDLAVRGKLTRQDPADEPASVLLGRIETEKRRRHEAGEIRKPKALQPVSEAERPFEVPEGWVWARLGHLVELWNGRAYSRSELLQSGTPVIRIQNLNGGTSWYYSDLDLPDEKYCDPGDLLYAWSTSFGPYIWGGPRAIFHYHIWRVEPHHGDVDRDYLYHFLQDLTEDAKNDTRGSTMVHLTKSGMEQYPVPLPPEAEQRRIAERVDSMMAYCDRLADGISARQATAQQLLTIILASA
ncbi:MAG: restriction endonuclease subunit S [Bacteroidota bacterium]